MTSSSFAIRLTLKLSEYPCGPCPYGTPQTPVPRLHARCIDRSTTQSKTEINCVVQSKQTVTRQE